MSGKQLALGTFAVLLAGHLILVPFRAGLREMSTDFPNYYTAAVLTLKHQPLRLFYDWVWFQRQIHYAGIDHQLGTYVSQTPLTMLPFLPLALLPPLAAKQVWVSFGLIFLAASFWLLASVSRLGKIELAVFMLLAHVALGNNFRWGQYYLFLLLLLSGAVWCLLRGRPSLGGALLGLICGLKLYAAPFLLYFVARRQWRALAGFLGTVAALGVAALALFGWNGVWYFVTAAMPRAADGSVTDPYHPNGASLIVFLRRMFLPEAELNPHPMWPAPAAFFFLRTLYVLGIAVLVFLALAKCRRDRERQALGWFIVILFALAPNQASYHYALLIVAIALLLPGESRLHSLVLAALYVLVELPLFPWDAALFPKAWLLLLLFLAAGWPFLRNIGLRPALVAAAVVAGIAVVTTVQRMRIYQTEVPQTRAPAITQAAAIYSASPVFGANGWMYDAIATDRYALRRSAGGAVETLTFDGDAFRPAQSQHASTVFFELVQSGVSGIYAYDLASRRSRPIVVGGGLNPTEPAVSPDGTKLAFIADGSLYLLEGDRRSIVASGWISNPSFFPDGSQIAFTRGKPGQRLIAAATLTGAKVRTLVIQPDCFEPAVSPNGRFIAFTCSETGQRHIWIENLHNGLSRRITQGSCNNEFPAWAPDSKSLVFSSDCNRGMGLPALYRAAVP